MLGVAAIASVISSAAVGTTPKPQPGAVHVLLQPGVVDHGPTRIEVSGLAATSVRVRLVGADDPSGVPDHWPQYRWRRLSPASGGWSGALAAPPLHGIYALELRVKGRRPPLESPNWLLRVLPPGALRRPALATPLAVVREYVRELPGDQVLVAERPWPHPAYDRRDARLQRLFVIAHAPIDDNTPDTQRGVFITTFRNGYHGRWRLLEATTSPPG